MEHESCLEQRTGEEPPIGDYFYFLKYYTSSICVSHSINVQYLGVTVSNKLIWGILFFPSHSQCG